MSSFHFPDIFLYIFLALMGVSILMAVFYSLRIWVAKKIGRNSNGQDAAANPELQLALRIHREQLEYSINRELIFRRKLVGLMIRKEQLVNESNRMGDIDPNLQLRNEIFALEQEIRTVQTQLGEEIARQRGLEDAEVELTNRNDNVLRSRRIQRMSEGINALLAISNNGESRRDHTDIFFPITQNLGQEELREKILQNIIHKKVFTKGNVSPSSDDDDGVGDEETMKRNIFLSPITCGDEEDSTTLIPSSIQNMCAICCDNYQEGDDIAYSRNEDCHHFYHVECILEWLMRDNNDDCPLCRSAFLVD